MLQNLLKVQKASLKFFMPRKASEGESASTFGTTATGRESMAGAVWYLHLKSLKRVWFLLVRFV